MTTLREAAQRALAWLDRETPFTRDEAYEEELAIQQDLRAALAAPHHCAYPNCLGGTVGTFCHDACIKKDGHARTTD